jgi:hypothetical protein
LGKFVAVHPIDPKARWPDPGTNVTRDRNIHSGSKRFPSLETARFYEMPGVLWLKYDLRGFKATMAVSSQAEHRSAQHYHPVKGRTWYIFYAPGRGL